MILREATDDDLDGILAIFNQVIATSTAVWIDDPTTMDERRQWMAALFSKGFPIFVAIDARGVAGYGSFGEFRGRPGYRFTVEHSIHVRDVARRSGVGARAPRTIDRARRGDGEAHDDRRHRRRERRVARVPRALRVPRGGETSPGRGEVRPVDRSRLRATDDQRGGSPGDVRFGSFGERPTESSSMQRELGRFYALRSTSTSLGSGPSSEYEVVL